MQMNRTRTGLLLGMAILWSSDLEAQDTKWAPLAEGACLINLDYVVDFNADRGVANWVAYELLPAETVGEVKRKSGFKRDDRVPHSPVHKDYTHSGFDRGHLKPAADSKSSSEKMAASFLMTNVAPQTPQLNRGSWKQLEEATRDWAHEFSAVYVVCGPGRTSQGALANGHVEVPATFWKAILRTAPDTACIAFMMPNQLAKLAPFPSYRIAVDSLEVAVGMDLFPQLPDAVEQRIEASTQSRWSGLQP
jgi:endonuclease G